MVLLRKKVRIQQLAWIVQQVGRLKLVAPSANLARLELSATSKVKLAITVESDSIVKVKRVIVSPLQIQRLAWIVQQVGRLKLAAPSALFAQLGRLGNLAQRRVLIVQQVSFEQEEVEMALRVPRVQQECTRSR